MTVAHFSLWYIAVVTRVVHLTCARSGYVQGNASERLQLPPSDESCKMVWWKATVYTPWCTPLQPLRCCSYVYVLMMCSYHTICVMINYDILFTWMIYFIFSEYSQRPVTAHDQKCSKMNSAHTQISL